MTRNQSKLNQMPLIVDGWDMQTIRNEQMNDSAIGPIFTMIDQQQNRPCWKDICDMPPLTKNLWNQWNRLVVCSGMLYRKYQKDNGDCLQLVVPSKYRKQVLSLFHDIPTAAHLGWKKCLNKIVQDFYLPCLKDDVKAILQNVQWVLCKKTKQNFKQSTTR